MRDRSAGRRRNRGCRGRRSSRDWQWRGDQGIGPATIQCPLPTGHCSLLSPPLVPRPLIRYAARVGGRISCVLSSQSGLGMSVCGEYRAGSRSQPDEPIAGQFRRHTSRRRAKDRALEWLGSWENRRADDRPSSLGWRTVACRARARARRSCRRRWRRLDRCGRRQQIVDHGANFDLFRPLGVGQRLAIEMLVQSVLPRHARGRQEIGRIANPVGQILGPKFAGDVPQAWTDLVGGVA